MKKTTFSQFPIDNSSILFLSLIRKDHTNTYRFSMDLSEEVCPKTLQLAVDRVYRRFPTVIAGFHPGFFQYVQVPAQTAPLVKEDPGFLITMSKEELRSCAFRVYYKGNQISIEAFHALADGFGAIACFTTLVAEYLRMKYGISIPVSETLVDLDLSPMLQELEDAYLEYEAGKPLHLPSRYSYQLPGGNGNRDAIHSHTIQLPTQTILEASRAEGVSVNTLISAVMAASIMELQQKHSSSRIRPVRIMVPADLRRLFPSRTLRNFVLYALPTMEPEEHGKSFRSLLQSFSNQIQTQFQRDKLASIMAYNVRLQRAWYFRIIPLSVKLAIMRLIYRYFGESNSSLTLTNLGNIRLPEQMQPYVKGIEVHLTPRVRSPYNCSIISYSDTLSIHISRLPKDSELEAIFRRRLDAVLAGDLA